VELDALNVAAMARAWGARHLAEPLAMTLRLHAPIDAGGMARCRPECDRVDDERAVRRTHPDYVIDLHWAEVDHA